jgi:integrase
VPAILKERDITLHALRRSHASHTLASNIHPKIMQERLGHSSIAIMMDIYSPAFRQDHGRAARGCSSLQGRLLQGPTGLSRLASLP